MKTINTFMTPLVCFVLAACSTAPKQASGGLEWQYEEGWAYEKGFSGRTFEKFFAIGTWHVPGYVFTDSAEVDEQAYQKNAALFRERMAPLNMVFMTPGLEKAYMSEKIHILNPFSPMLHKFLDQAAGLPDGKDKDYYRNRRMEKIVDSPEFESYLDAEIKKLLEKLPNDKYIYSHIDEIALGGVSKWTIPPAIGAKITERLKLQDKNALVFVDLLGHARGSSYLFEKLYLQTHDALPPDPPYEAATPGARACDLPLLGFYQAYNGLPVYQFHDGKYGYAEYGFDTLQSIWFENIRIIAEGYKDCGDVFGINAFRDFNTYPILAGITMDALQAGLGKEVPVWLYFDGNGYAKPAHVSPEAYIELVKCQIYTSVVHGATGILFWNDWRKTPEVYDALLPMLAELNGHLEVIKLNAIHKTIDGDLHVAIKQDKKGQKYIIATNTHKTESLPLNIPDTQKKTLAPLEVYVSKL